MEKFGEFKGTVDLRMKKVVETTIDSNPDESELLSNPGEASRVPQ